MLVLSKLWSTILCVSTSLDPQSPWHRCLLIGVMGVRGRKLTAKDMKKLFGDMVIFYSMIVMVVT